MAENNFPDNKQKPDEVSPALIEKMLSNQEKELALRQQDLELRKSNDQNNYSYAMAALKANQEDREASRIHFSTYNKYWIFAFIVMIILLSVIFVVAIIYNKDQLVMEIVKAIVYLGAGGLGGYSYAKTNSDSGKKDNA